MHLINKPVLRNGFTLAEVLVTLAIIGVVAALSIPLLMQAVQKMQYQTALKKDLSVIAQAVMQIKEDNGGSLDSIFNATTTKAQLISIFGTRLAFVKTCVGNGNSGCWVDFPNVKTFDGNPFPSGDLSLNTYPQAVLKDGTVLRFQTYNSSCTSTR